MIDQDECFKLLFDHIIHGDAEKTNRNNVPRWMGCKVVKLPEDLILYQQVLYKHRPDVLVEVGTRYGGSALFFSNMFDLLGHGQVITVDIKDFPKRPQHPRIKYLLGGSLSPYVLDDIRKDISGKSCMVSLDGEHAPEYVIDEMECYSRFVTPNQYMVVEDIYQKDATNPGHTADIFLRGHPEFKKTDITKQFLMHVTRDGWLLKKS
jgi:cephalosporin hydroxylase